MRRKTSEEKEEGLIKPADHKPPEKKGKKKKRGGKKQIERGGDEPIWKVKRGNHWARKARAGKGKSFFGSEPSGGEEADVKMRRAALYKFKLEEKGLLFLRAVGAEGESGAGEKKKAGECEREEDQVLNIRRNETLPSRREIS